MSSVLSEHPWLAGILTMLLKFWARLAQSTHADKRNCYQMITQVLDELVTSMEIWVVESSSEILAHIAVWHRELESYGGYLLCSDRTGRTFLLDLHTSRFVEAAEEILLLIGGVNQAKRFIDVFLSRCEENSNQKKG